MVHALLRQRVIVCLLYLVVFPLQSIAPVAAAQPGGLPVLNRITAAQPPSQLMAITGHGFTPGGLVYLAISSPADGALLNEIWTVASSSRTGPNGSQDPAQGFVQPGTVREVIDLFPETVYGPNGSQDPAQGYQAAAQSTLVPTAIYGPHGSQDPARGYVPAGESGWVPCGHNLMIRALDTSASTWSDPVQFTTTC